MYTTMYKSCHCSSIPNKNAKGDSFVPFIQPKLNVNSPADAFEQEADHIAEQVVNSSVTPVGSSFFSPSFQPSAIQRKESGNTTSAPSSVMQNLVSAGGQALQTDTKHFMESRLGVNLENIRIHNDARAHEAAASIQAQAFTHRNKIVFGAGQYQPTTTNGKKLIAHELAHTIQQSKNSNTGIQRKEIPKNFPCDPIALSRKDFVKKTGSTDFGLTHIAVDQSNLLSSPSIQFKKKGGKVYLVPMELNMPAIDSQYTGPDQFIEGKTKTQIESDECPMDFYPVKWIIGDKGADKIREAEQEHCDDYNLAYSESLYPFLQIINKASGIPFATEAKALAYLKGKLKYEPHEWFTRFTCMLNNSTIRDYPQYGEPLAWHSPKPILQLLPKANTQCGFVRMVILPESFKHLDNKHPGLTIIPVNC